MPKSLPDIIYDKSKITPIVDAESSFYNIPFYKDDEYFRNYESYVAFIKGVEKLVRTNDRYNKYISYLKKEVKLDHCQVFKNITDEDADIEMHHGPIFTLFDYCAIILEYFLIKKWKITTARVADVVLDEHQKNRIQVVMVSSTVHEEIHNGQIFINQKQAYGDLQAFINKYAIAISDDYREMVNRYVDRSLMYDSSDFGVLELNKKIL
jgi:ATP-dependent helicase/DNAse subunit B